MLKITTKNASEQNRLLVKNSVTFKITIIIILSNGTKKWKQFQHIKEY